MELIMTYTAALLFVLLCVPTHTHRIARHHDGIPFADLEARLEVERAHEFSPPRRG